MAAVLLIKVYNRSIMAKSTKSAKEKDQAKLDRVTQAFLKMKKFDIAELKKAQM